MLIDDRSPPDEPALPPWSPNWRLWRWVAGAILTGVVGVVAGGAVGTVLVIVAFAAGCRAIDEALPYRQGLREWHQ
jgi:hypothetical protein